MPGHISDIRPATVWSRPRKTGPTVVTVTTVNGNMVTVFLHKGGGSALWTRNDFLRHYTKVKK